MIKMLHEVLFALPGLLENESIWEGVIIDRKEPITYRLYTSWSDDVRICLHRFNRLSETGEAMFHPHPWPGAFRVLKGGYKMQWGHAENMTDPPLRASTFYLAEGSEYEIDDPKIFHSVEPDQPTYTVMVNGPDWSIAHQLVRRTANKGLAGMSPAEIEGFLGEFQLILSGN